MRSPLGIKAFYGVLIAVVTVLAITSGLGQSPAGDFHVFWAAGRNFWQGADLYAVVEGQRQFIYPPFAGLVFGVLALLPLVPSAVVFGLCNVLLLVMMFRLSHRLLEETFPGRRPGPWPGFLAVLFAHRYLLNNISMVQMNVVIVTLVLAGVLYLVRSRHLVGAMLVTFAAGIKIMPVIFVIWAVVRYRRRALPGIAMAVAIMLALPALVRGPTRSVADIEEYHATFLGQFQSGEVITRYKNQNIGAMLYRLTQPGRNDALPSFQAVSVPEPIVSVLYRVTILGMLVAFILLILKRTASGLPESPFELAAGFLTWHLVSGITWTAHLVSFLFIFMVFFGVIAARLGRATRRMVWAGWSLIVLLGFGGRDFVGAQGYIYLGGYSALTWLMIVLWVVALRLAWSGPIDTEVVLEPSSSPAMESR